MESRLPMQHATVYSYLSCLMWYGIVCLDIPGYVPDILDFRDNITQQCKNPEDSIPITENKLWLWKTCSDQTFYFTENQTPGEGAYEECGKYGGVPTTLVTGLKILTCLQELQSRVPGYRVTHNAWYYTGFRDSGLNRTFFSCPDLRRFPEEMWGQGEPDNYRGLEYLSALNLCPSCPESGYGDVNPERALRVLCHMPLPDSNRRIFSNENKKKFFWTKKRSFKNWYRALRSEEARFQCVQDCVSGRQTIFTAFTTTTPPPPTTKPVYKKEVFSIFKAAKISLESCKKMQCTKKPNLDNNGHIKRNLKFLLSGVCGTKQFIILDTERGLELLTGSTQMSYTAVWRRCCDIGARPAVFNSEAENLCLWGLITAKEATYRKLEDAYEGQVYTAYVDVGLNRKFVSCPSLQPLPDAWFLDADKNGDGAEACMMGSIVGSKPFNKLLFFDLSCYYTGSALCEHIISPTNTTLIPTQASKRN